MSLPKLPGRTGDGYSWMDELKGGWYSVGVWGSDGWNLGGWPYQLVVHYDGESFGLCIYVEGDLDVKEFATREGRDRATDEYFVWFNNFHDSPTAPRSMDDPRLGPCRL